MNAWKLRVSMAGTLAIIFGLTTLVFAVVLTLANIGFSLITIGVLVVVLNVAQWLLAPYLVGWIYKVRALKQDEKPELHQMVSDLSKKSGISTPQLMLSQIPLPNAFAYGSPLSGSRVAVTQGLLDNLDSGEVEAVLGHELGHLKHRDVQVMMVVSFLPALFYYIGYTMMLSGIFGGSSDNKKGGGGNNALIGLAFMAFSWVLTLFTLYLSRLREYYADRHSASIVENGAQNLSTGLVTIVELSKNPRKQKEEQKSSTSFQALFIANPDRAQNDSADLHAAGITNKQELLRQKLAEKPSKFDSFAEIMSTHPNIIKRLYALQELSNSPQTAA
jgi:heat shock protein HtpX